MPDLHPAFLATGTAPDTAPIWCVDSASWPIVRERLPSVERTFAEAAGFKPEPGNHLLLSGADGSVAGVLFAVDPAAKRDANPFLPGKLPGVQPAGRWRFVTPPPDPRLAALAFALGTYRFTRYRKSEAKDIKLELPDGVDASELTRIVEAVILVRDLVNTPSNDCGPAELEAAARTIAERYGAMFGSVHM